MYRCIDTKHTHTKACSCIKASFEGIGNITCMMFHINIDTHAACVSYLIILQYQVHTVHSHSCVSQPSVHSRSWAAHTLVMLHCSSIFAVTDLAAAAPFSLSTPTASQRAWPFHLAMPNLSNLYGLWLLRPPHSCTPHLTSRAQRGAHWNTRGYHFLTLLHHACATDRDRWSDKYIISHEILSFWNNCKFSKACVSYNWLWNEINKMLKWKLFINANINNVYCLQDYIEI